MKVAWTTNSDTLDKQYDERFIGRVYETAAVVWAVAAAIVYAQFGAPSLLGLSMGAGIALGSLWLIELTVRFLIVPGTVAKPRHFGFLLLLKLPLLTAVMGGAVWAVFSGYANVFALVGGVAMIHAVIPLKALGNWLVASRPTRAAKAARALKVKPQGEKAATTWRMAPGD